MTDDVPSATLELLSLFEAEAAELDSRSCNFNGMRRKLYSEVELELMDAQMNVNLSEKSKAIIVDRLAKISSGICLLSCDRSISKIEQLARFIGPFLYTVLIAVFLALPILVIQRIEKYYERKNVLSKFNFLTERIKRASCAFMLAMTGVDVIVEGNEQKHFENHSIVMFTHGSNLDAFLVGQIIPMHFKVPGKTDVFLVPFFSWIGYAFGGFPIDRKDRSRAVETLEQLYNQAKLEGSSVALAVEGTRSKTGLLQQFKKGGFHIQEKSGWPIVPIVIFGAFDLFSRDQLASVPGKVIIRVLPPITLSSLPASSDPSQIRAEMSIIVRREMLKSIRDNPAELAGRNVSLSFRIEGLMYVVGVIAATFLSLRLVANYVIVFGFSSVSFFLTMAIVSVIITLILYYINVHMVHWKKNKTD